MIKLKGIFKSKPLSIFFLTLLVLGELFLYFQPFKVFSKLNLEDYASQVIKTCEKASYRPTCYDETIPQLMKKISMEDAFRVTYLVQNQDRSYTYCHVLAHELSAQEVVKNPAGWKDVLTRVPSGQCSNGGIHGAFQERFRGEYFSDEEIEKIKPEIDELCEKREKWNPTGMEQASCYHALGHLTMYITAADIKKSLAMCKEIAIRPDGRNFAHLCYDGAFMQIYQPLEPEDFSLIKGKEVTKAGLKDFCSQFTAEEKGSCWSEGWPLFKEELKKPQGLAEYCGQASLKERDRCFSALIYVLTAIFNLDSEKVMNYCPYLPKDQIGRCFASAAGRMIEVDYRNIEKASALCGDSLKFDSSGTCFNTLLLYSGYNYKVGTAEFFEVCNALPENWKSQCLRKIR